jgi:hypothetical protein
MVVNPETSLSGHYTVSTVGLGGLEHLAGDFRP